MQAQEVIAKQKALEEERARKKKLEQEAKAKKDREEQAKFQDIFGQGWGAPVAT